MWQAARLALGTASALGLSRFAYGLLVPAMRDDLHWTLAEAGAMSTANGLGYLVGALVTASAVRRWGVAVAFRAGMALTAVTLAATAISDDFAVLLALRAAAGVVGAVVFVSGGVIASRLAHRVGSGTPITVYFAGAGLGIVFGGVTIPLLGHDWRVAWLVLGVAAGLATPACWTAAHADDDPPTATAGRARVRALWRAAAAYLLFALGYITYITFLSAYLADRDASTGQVVLTWVALGLGVLVAPALWSRPIGAWPGTRALAAVLVVLGAGAGLALVAPAPAVVVASAIVYGATFMGVPAAITALIRAGVPAADWTATLAAFTTVFAAGQTAGPWLAGMVADRTSTDATVAWTAVLCVAAALLVVRVGPPRRPGAPRPPRRRPAAPARPRPGS
ncbi:YbfB/YjiJ family MFS transporter [Saccharothrix sp. S26]|uniref:YbfB/YjiJ family MFS transporter n=1 Tax=Saccharothrix sp. S26 TaxID=2907215 RepID=UPI001F2D5A13|nr:YbfB/YjiJ family MFS transporter [Saccharothrix sp. S26]MCE6995080.1 YbfB/YjiJ family MFS transporter [Saccharothrix sp. S26]